jgi:hypothetical protein
LKRKAVKGERGRGKGRRYGDEATGCDGVGSQGAQDYFRKDFSSWVGFI